LRDYDSVKQHISQEKHRKRLAGATQSLDKLMQPLPGTVPLGEGARLDPMEQAWRLKAFRTVLENGLPLRAIDGFASLLEQAHRNPRFFALPESSHLARGMLPALSATMSSEIRECLAGKVACAIWDGATRCGEVLVVVIRAVDEDRICHVLFAGLPHWGTCGLVGT